MPEPATTTAVKFTALNAVAYDQLMGRWSRKLAPLLVQFGGLADGDCVLDVGCGTGSLIFVLPRIANISKAVGIDEAQVYLDHARSLDNDPRIEFQRADAIAMPFSDASFDRAYCLLVLQFIPDATKAVAEMRRVVHPGGVVVAAVWELVQWTAAVAHNVGHCCCS